jgi:type II secretory pathway component PulM
VTFDLRQISNVFSRMSPRERTLLTMAGVVVLVTILYTFVIDPLISGRTQLAAQVARKEDDLQKIAELRTRYLMLAQKLEAGQSVLSRTKADFSPFTWLETTISQVIPRQRISSMSPDKKDVTEQLVEETVEFKLTQVSLEQLVNLLYRIEKSEHPLRVTRLRVKKRANDIYNFDIVATVSLVRTKS